MKTLPCSTYSHIHNIPAGWIAAVTRPVCCISLCEYAGSCCKALSFCLESPFDMLDTHLNDPREYRGGADLCSLLLSILICMTRPLDCVRSDIFGDHLLSSHTSRAYDTSLYSSLGKELSQSSRPNTGIRKKASGPCASTLGGKLVGDPPLHATPDPRSAIDDHLPWDHVGSTSRPRLCLYCVWQCSDTLQGCAVPSSWVSLYTRPRAGMFGA